MNEPVINTSGQGPNSSEPPKGSLPRPEDVPEGEVWLIRPHENADPVPAFRVHASKYGPGKRWAHYRVGGSMLGFADDEYVTLMSRMVPECKGSVSRCPDKFSGEECRFMHPPECYCGE